MTGIFGPVTFILPDLLGAFQEVREVPPVAGGGLLRGKSPALHLPGGNPQVKHHDL